VIVVSNASPIMNLATVGQTNLLQQLYGGIFVPDAVFQELSAIGSARPDSTIPQALSRIATRSVRSPDGTKGQSSASPAIHEFKGNSRTAEYPNS
jgi:predicted nucleic acid-binding protein